jgi:prophage antirepressor-like protein
MLWGRTAAMVRPPRRSACGRAKPLFVGYDLLVALNYSDLSNVGKSVAHVPKEWRGRDRVPTPSGVQEMVVLSEQGLYFFLGRSDKPKALTMQKWVAGEVLP